jgi:hypothetical protein
MLDPQLLLWPTLYCPASGLEEVHVLKADNADSLPSRGSPGQLRDGPTSSPHLLPPWDSGAELLAARLP